MLFPVIAIYGCPGLGSPLPVGPPISWGGAFTPFWDFFAGPSISSRFLLSYLVFSEFLTRYMSESRSPGPFFSSRGLPRLGEPPLALGIIVGARFATSCPSLLLPTIGSAFFFLCLFVNKAALVCSAIGELHLSFYRSDLCAGPFVLGIFGFYLLWGCGFFYTVRFGFLAPRARPGYGIPVRPLYGHAFR